MSKSTISAGRELYLEKHCSHCHDANGDGGVNLTNRDLSNPNYVFEALQKVESVAVSACRVGVRCCPGHRYGK
jgi:mono/diheme cytochrome c family protein